MNAATGPSLFIQYKPAAANANQAVQFTALLDCRCDAAALDSACSDHGACVDGRCQCSDPKLCRPFGQCNAIRVRFHIIRTARIENVGKYQSCMVSKLRIIWKQTVGSAAADHTCECHTGYSGDHCEHSLGCDSDPCHEGLRRGTCTAGGAAYTCVCESGWEGANCDRKAT